MGHEKVKPCRRDHLFRIVQGFGKDQLPAGEAHEFPEEEEAEGIARDHYAEHREDKGDVVEPIMPFALDMSQVPPGIDHIGDRPQQDQPDEEPGKRIQLEKMGHDHYSSEHEQVRSATGCRRTKQIIF